MIRETSLAVVLAFANESADRAATSAPAAPPIRTRRFRRMDDVIQSQSSSSECGPLLGDVRSLLICGQYYDTAVGFGSASARSATRRCDTTVTWVTRACAGNADGIRPDVTSGCRR